MKKSILVVSDNKLFIDGINVELNAQGFDSKLITNLALESHNRYEVACLSDVFLLEDVLKDCDAIVYENMDSKQSELNNLTAITNLVNACVNVPDKKIIYIGNQKGYNTSPFEITMDENAVNNFTKEILPPVRHSLLMELEVLRGINEGNNGVIFSTAPLLSGSEALDAEIYRKTYIEYNAVNYFTQIGTLLKLIMTVIGNKVTGKYLLYDVEITFEQLVLKTGNQQKSFWKKITDAFWSGPKMNRLLLNNDLSRQQLKFELKKI